ncbi:hypothetical protein PAXINDRAFT_22035 [Paxillus involutus ATCC 200175]|uniref:Unplaced genomic scaffold PAXINscaffold_2295, whole genome shotgun sequence n=1 Tax=Paxillus involutus ATCC 200175 TaxID=664439 RepID=A0A0C9TBR8_PAXIN|nr:hypothetical protein PAXINDRAFT_22035 [Paxillus involutus ATCC 200175]
MTPIPKPAAPAGLQGYKRRKCIPEHLNQVAPHSQSPSPLLSRYHYQSHLLIASYATRPPPSESQAPYQGSRFGTSSQ